MTDPALSLPGVPWDVPNEKEGRCPVSSRAALLLDRNIAASSFPSMSYRPGIMSFRASLALRMPPRRRLSRQPRQSTVLRLSRQNLSRRAPAWQPRFHRNKESCLFVSPSPVGMGSLLGRGRWRRSMLRAWSTAARSNEHHPRRFDRDEADSESFGCIPRYGWHQRLRFFFPQRFRLALFASLRGLSDTLRQWRKGRVKAA